jgi:hypothetical protein
MLKRSARPVGTNECEQQNAEHAAQPLGGRAPRRKLSALGAAANDLESAGWALARLGLHAQRRHNHGREQPSQGLRALCRCEALVRRRRGRSLQAMRDVKSGASPPPLVVGVR